MIHSAPRTPREVTQAAMAEAFAEVAARHTTRKRNRRRSK